jgi:5-bromo-4-chloroindolyl phosphate hydrolysis protein
MLTTQPLKQRELNRALKDIRRQLQELSRTVDNGLRYESLKEAEQLYSLVFDMRQLIQEGGIWEPDN